MTTQEHDPIFSGSIPDVYDRYLVPLIFEPYADDLVARLGSVVASSVLEVAAGTGVVTRAMATRLPASVSITATDLNEPMIAHAAARGTSRPVDWQPADVMRLPFDDASFDAVVCQFGVMFFPDRVRAFAEILRVLRPGGMFLFNVWDRIGTNDFARVVNDAVATVFQDDPPMFLSRTPHGYHEERLIRADLSASDYQIPVEFHTLEARSRAASPDIPAVAYCQGTPLRNEIEARDPSLLVEATNVSAIAIGEEFGLSDVDGRIRGYVVTATRS